MVTLLSLETALQKTLNYIGKVLLTYKIKYIIVTEPLYF